MQRRLVVLVLPAVLLDRPAVLAPEVPEVPLSQVHGRIIVALERLAYSEDVRRQGLEPMFTLTFFSNCWLIF